MTLDPVTLAVIQNGLRQVASEMDLVHEKTSFSPAISEGFDRSTACVLTTSYIILTQCLKTYRAPQPATSRCR